MAAGISLEDAIFRFLLDYRTSRHATTECSPAELHLNRRLYTRFDTLLRRKQESCARNYVDNRDVNVDVGMSVLYRNYNSLQKWSEGEIVSMEGNVTAKVQNKDGEEVRRHVDQLIKRPVEAVSSPQKVETENPGLPEQEEVVPEVSLRRSGRERRAPIRLDL